MKSSTRSASPSRCILALLLLVWGGASASAQPTVTRTGLAEAIAGVLDNSSFADAYWGALIVDLDNGQTLFDRNAERRFIPASNMKLVTTAAALDLLGPSYRYVTRLYADGPVRDGTLIGSLVVEGSGDPTFGGRYTGGDLTMVFRQWADSLAANGIRRVSGSVVGDDGIFDVGSRRGEGWAWDDLKWYYAAEISGLQFNEGTINLEVHGTTPGEPGRLQVEPDIGYATFLNESLTTAGGDIQEGYDRDLDANRFRVTTTVPAGRVEKESLAIRNPTDYFVRTMISVFRRAGIQVDGESVDVDTWGQRPQYYRMMRLATHESPPLSAIVGQTNTDSNNLYAEHLLRTIGARAYHGVEFVPGSVDAGVAVANPFLRRLGIDPMSFQITDGSGLSAMNRLTPVGIIGLLQGMHGHQNRSIWDAFYRSLPVGGLTGTLSSRYRSGDARGNVRAKTGYISGARTLSGYVRAANGHMMAFSLLCNNYSTSTSRVNSAQDEVVELLADYAGS